MKKKTPQQKQIIIKSSVADQDLDRSGSLWSIQIKKSGTGPDLELDQIRNI
jgi:hypothetical protein